MLVCFHEDRYELAAAVCQFPGPAKGCKMICATLRVITVSCNTGVNSKC